MQTRDVLRRSKVHILRVRDGAQGDFAELASELGKLPASYRLIWRWIAMKLISEAISILENEADMTPIDARAYVKQRLP